MSHFRFHFVQLRSKAEMLHNTKYPPPLPFAILKKTILDIDEELAPLLAMKPPFDRIVRILGQIRTI